MFCFVFAFVFLNGTELPGNGNLFLPGWKVSSSSPRGRPSGGEKRAGGWDGKSYSLLAAPSLTFLFLSHVRAPLSSSTHLVFRATLGRGGHPCRGGEDPESHSRTPSVDPAQVGTAGTDTQFSDTSVSMGGALSPMPCSPAPPPPFPECSSREGA